MTFEGVWAFLTSGWDAAKTIAAIAGLFTILSTSYGLYARWRSSGRQLVKRMLEFIKAQDKRLEHSRDKLDEVVRRPSPSHEQDSPLFPREVLERTFVKMKLGRMKKAPSEVTRILQQATSAHEVALESAQNQRNEQKVAHLLLGAEAASRVAHNGTDQAAAHSVALSHFNKVLEIDSTDPEALQFAGLVLLKMANATGALDRFTELLAVVGPTKDAQAIARAYRLQATAYEKMPEPQLGNANQALGRALALYPQSTAPLEIAEAHEHRGDIRKAMGSRGVANQSYQHALTVFQLHQTIPEARAGFLRTATKIAELNNLSTTQNTANGTAMHAPLPQLTNGALQNGTQSIFDGNGAPANSATASERTERDHA